MAQKIIQYERAGVNPKWPSYKSVLDRIAKGPHVSDEYELNGIREYVTRGDAFAKPSMPVPNRNNATRSSAEWMAVTRAHEVLATAANNPQWLQDLAHWVRYYQVGIKQVFFWACQFDILAKAAGNARRQQNYNIQTASNMMAAMAILGWKDALIYMGYLSHAALNRRHQLVLQYEEEQRRAQAFMLRLFADWVGDVSHQWPAYAYDEPIYEALLLHWRTPNPEDLLPCLLAACDRHTWQSGKDSLKNFYDFNQDWHLERVPVEILYILRLRQWEGLANPQKIDHPLMATPYDQLPPEQSVPELDELMQGVLKRAREDWPQYDEVLSLSALKSGHK
ncbi:hypothetical protein M2262_002823 [Pseudomonas sp. BIGb0408]|uniref:Uncharacterized protein n=1 Tax=Phytopseudomonas flavescens TaxID=29435 RepID=A0A7Y9XK07_9GAMM|nr:hypothetical protein [Pseudomonas sp. BIGb0408]NYH72657.1 hypothetical protein [Pseudomonas flavescens]